ncbi:MAG: DUF2735 domain-containing protein [Pseudomonadota bacterium]
MTANTHRETAKVIPFPKGGRSGFSGGSNGRYADDLLASMHVSYVDYGSGSYHDAAIRDAKRNHEH